MLERISGKYQYLKAKRLLHNVSELKKKYPDLFLNDGWDTAGATGGPLGLPELDWLMLSGIIRSTKAKNVLELGSGRSTVLIARILAEIHAGGDFSFTSMEESEHWLQQTEEKLSSLLSADIRKKVNLLYSPKINCQFGMFFGTCYEHVPQLNYDLIYVDGPDTEFKACLDAMKILSNLDSKTNILVDGRFKSVIAYRMLLPKAKFENFVHNQTIIRNVDRNDINLEYSCYDVIGSLLSKKSPDFLSSY